VILTTNLMPTLDSAFHRRLRFMVEFPTPDVKLREKVL
jgi:SpoVK/Ycf46/Vps4 family AAA+-type ATPase